MTLKPPFTGTNPLLLAKNIVNKEFTSLLPEQYSDDLKQIVQACLAKDEEERPNASQILKMAADKVIMYSDELKEKEIGLADEIVNMNKKINMGTGFGGTHTRPFGTTSYNPHQFQAKFNTTANNPIEDPLRQTQLVKIDSDVISKIG
jgi:serine/threonine protein kinase